MGLRHLAIAVLLSSGGCAGDGGGNLTSTIRLELSAQRIDWTDGVAAAPALTATLITSDGTETDVTASAAFAVSPPELAGVTDATLVASGAVAGPGTVTATFDGLVDMKPFEVFVNQTVTGTADPAAPGLFEAATADSSKALTIVYPPAGAVIPPNLGDMDVHWTDPAANNVYEVTLSGGYVTLKTYIKALGAKSWLTFAAEHTKLLSSGSHGLELSVRVRGLATAAPATFIEGTETLRIAAEEVRGGVYFWNTTQGAILRHDMSAQGTPPERFYPQVGQDGGCVGCHAVSRDGTVVAYRQGGGNMNFGNVLRVEGLQKQLPQDTQQWNFAAVHPNDEDLFTTTTTGLYRTVIATGVTTPVYEGGRISHPDISAPGTAIVATALTLGIEIFTRSSTIVLFDYDLASKTVGPPRTLVAATAGANPYYPSFSPDSEWVIYNQAVGDDSYDNPNAELWVTKADGSAPPIRLTAAEVTGTNNSWPKWTPFVTHEPTATGSEKMFWFTFASRRPFGVRSDATQKPQLWLAPFFPERAAAGLPSTGPAVRLPFQILTEGNHIAQWTEEIVVIQ